MKALTIRQPWAWAIAMGHKRVENRSWTTPYRGPLAIHAGRAPASEAEQRACREILEGLGVVMRDRPFPERRLLAAGAVVAVAELVGICPPGSPACRCSPAWAMPGQAHWLLRYVEALDDPVPASGRQGLWSIDLPGYELADRERARGRVR